MISRRVSSFLQSLRKANPFQAREGAYQGARRTRGGEYWAAPEGDADADLLPDLPELRRRSNELLRNSPLAIGAITAKVTSVVGTGLTLNASIDRDYLQLSDEAADAWEAQAEREWALFSESPNCDVRRTLSFADQQDLAFRSVLGNGDHFIALVTLDQPHPGWPFSFALQHIEGHRISNPSNQRDTDTLIGGVEKDALGAPVRYHVCSLHPGALTRPGKALSWSTLPAFGSRTGRRLTLHLYRVLRAEQTRGVPDLAPVMETLKQLGRYTDAEVDRAVKSALFLAFVTTQDGGGFNFAEYEEARAGHYQNPDFRKKVALDHSSVVTLFPGDNIQFSDPKAPNAAADSFLTTFTRNTAAAMELPHELVQRHFQSSYSAARGALLMAWQFFNGRRAWLARELCQPVYEAVLMDAISAGRMQAPGFFEDPFARQAWLGSEWIGEAPPVIDENKAVTAAMDRVNAGFSTIKRETASLTGQDYDRVRRQRDKERRTDPAATQPTAAPTQAPIPPSAADLDRADRLEAAL